jgi:hypothetical protein
MATKLRTIIDDIEVDLKQMIDDQSITKAQIAYWCIVVGNNILSKHIPKHSTGAFLSTFIIPVSYFTSNANPNQVMNRKYFELPGSVFDFDRDSGIEFVAYYNEKEKLGDLPEFTRVQFSRTTISEMENLVSRFEAPTPDNPYFYRVHQYVYLLGVECIPIKNVEVGLFMTISPVQDIDIDAPFDFPEELIEVLKRRVLDLGRFSLLLPQERANDGANMVSGSQVPTNKLVSVADTSQQAQ